MAVARQEEEEEGQFVLWRGRVILRAKRPFEGQMRIWEEREKAVCVGEARNRGWVSCNGAVRERTGWVWAAQGSWVCGDTGWRDHPSMGGVCEHGCVMMLGTRALPRGSCRSRGICLGAALW